LLALMPHTGRGLPAEMRRSRSRISPWTPPNRGSAACSATARRPPARWANWRRCCCAGRAPWHGASGNW